jgi:hypothetical protein
MLRRPPPVATDPTPDRDLHYVLAVAAPLLQRMALRQLGDSGYTSSDTEFRAHLAGVKCWGVSSLEKRVALPLTADGTGTVPGQEGLVAGVACEVLLVTGDEPGDQIVVQRRPASTVPEEQQEEEDMFGELEDVVSTDEGEDQEAVEEQEQPGSGDAAGAAGVAADRALQGSASDAADQAGASEQQGQEEEKLLERSVDLYVKLPRAGASRVVAAELSQLVAAVSRRVLSSSSGTKGGKHQAEQQAAWAALQQEAQQLLEQLLFVMVSWGITLQLSSGFLAFAGSCSAGSCRNAAQHT